MLIIQREHITPHGGWHFVCPHCNLNISMSTMTQLRAVVANHYRANSLDLSETIFRQVVCKSTPSAQCVEKTMAGDVVAAFAKPVAAAIDAVSKAVGRPTNVRGCSGCRKRREKLNLLHQKLLGKT